MTDQLPKGMNGLNENVYEDGSAYKAWCKFFGREWHFSYIAGKRTLRGIFSAYETQRGWKNDNARKVLNKFFNDRLESFGQDWHDKHTEMYKETVAAENHLNSMEKWPDLLYHLPTLEQCIEYAATVAPEGLAKDWGTTIYYKTR